MAKQVNQSKTESVVAIVLALLFFFAAGGLFGWFACLNGWFASKNAEQDGNGIITAETGGMVVTETAEQGLSLAVSALSADTASEGYTVTATADSYNSDRILFWSVAWADESSVWASGKSVSDYITLTVSDDTHSATVVCLQAFGEQIIVSVSSPAGWVTASVTCDYVKRVGDGVTLTLTADGGETDTVKFTRPDLSSDGWLYCAGADNVTYTVYIDVDSLGVGTVTPETTATWGVVFTKAAMGVSVGGLVEDYYLGSTSLLDGVKTYKDRNFSFDSYELFSLMFEDSEESANALLEAVEANYGGLVVKNGVTIGVVVRVYYDEEDYDVVFVTATYNLDLSGFVYEA